MTRLWRSGDPIAAQSDADGTPQQFVWQGIAHPVDRIANHWRVDLEWWRLRIWRDYFKVTTGTGMLAVVYHDLEHDRWYLQRVYD
jgi:hypothetical protein